MVFPLVRCFVWILNYLESKFFNEKRFTEKRIWCIGTQVAIFDFIVNSPTNPSVDMLCHTTRLYIYSLLQTEREKKWRFFITAWVFYFYFKRTYWKTCNIFTFYFNCIENHDLAQRVFYGYNFQYTFYFKR